MSTASEQPLDGEDSRMRAAISAQGSPAGLASATEHQAQTVVVSGSLGQIPWGIRDAALALALAICAIVFIHKVATLLPDPSPVTGPLCTLSFELCLIGLALAFSVRKYHLSARHFGFSRYRRRDRSLPFLGAAGMLSSLLLWQAFSVHVHVVALRGAPNLGVTAFSSLFATVVLGLTVCVVAPIAEESFFRGFLFRALLNKRVSLRLGGHTMGFVCGFWPALAVSGMVFAAGHVQIALLCPFLAVSAVQTWIFWRSGSLWPAIFAHGTFNAVGFALAVKMHYF
jgi:membrane protease YdiL (CAAX protease family)